MSKCAKLRPAPYLLRVPNLPKKFLEILAPEILSTLDH
jgi:hypothetical protein